MSARKAMLLCLPMDADMAKSFGSAAPLETAYKTSIHKAMPTPLEIETVPLVQLHADGNNARLHPDANRAAIAGSLQRFGQREPLIVQRGTNKVVGGNGRLEVMRDLGWQTAVVSYVDLQASEAQALALALNRTAETAEWDTERLQAIIDACLADDVPLDDLGFDDASLKALMADPTDASAPVDGDHAALGDAAEPETPPVEMLPPGPEPDEDAPSPEAKPSRFKRGDVYLLDSPVGQHRVMCGSSADFGDVQRLMAGAKADLVFTDPPYNHGKHNKLLAANLRKNSYGALKEAGWDRDFDFADVSHNILSIMSGDCSVYICTSVHLFGPIIEWMRTWSHLQSYCVWAKSNPMPSLQKRHWTWSSELICYATRGKHTFNFPDVGHALNVWSIQKNPANTLHPTQKPVAVPRHAVAHSSVEGALVVDLFGGSGCTVMACAELGRLCYTMEVSEAYCETIVSRVERTYGGTAVLENR